LRGCRRAAASVVVCPKQVFINEVKVMIIARCFIVVPLECAEKTKIMEIVRDVSSKRRKKIKNP